VQEEAARERPSQYQDCRLERKRLLWRALRERRRALTPPLPIEREPLGQK